MLSIAQYFLMREYFADCTSIVDGMVGNTDSLAVVVKLLKNLIGNLFIIKTVGKGIGLGLAIARQLIVEKCGDYSPNKGVKFAILIPVQH